MTREEAILHMTLRREELKHSVGDLDEDIKAFDMAIEALEQESVFDKIKAEIEECKQYRGMTGNPVIDKHNIGLDIYYDLGLEKAIKIIDKYKEESNEEETGKEILAAMKESAEAVKNSPHYDFSCVTPLLDEGAEE